MHGMCTTTRIIDEIPVAETLRLGLRVPGRDGAYMVTLIVTMLPLVCQ